MTRDGNLDKSIVLVAGTDDRAAENLRSRIAAPGATATDQDAHGASDGAVVVFVTGPPRPDRSSWNQRVQAMETLEAAAAPHSRGVSRAIVLSRVGADPHSSNRYLRDLGEMEAAVLNSGIETLVLRVTHTFGPRSDPGPIVQWLMPRGNSGVSIDGSGAQFVQPIYTDDVITALAVAATTTRIPAPAVIELGGPETMPLAIFADLLNGGAVKAGRLRMHHRPRRIERWLPWFRQGASRDFVDIMATDSVAHETDFATHLGLKLHGVRDVWPNSPADDPLLVLPRAVASASSKDPTG